MLHEKPNVERGEILRLRVPAGRSAVAYRVVAATPELEVEAGKVVAGQFVRTIPPRVYRNIPVEFFDLPSYATND